jgi:hypothetical protein
VFEFCLKTLRKQVKLQLKDLRVAEIDSFKGLGTCSRSRELISKSAPIFKEIGVNLSLKHFLVFGTDLQNQRRFSS